LEPRYGKDTGWNDEGGGNVIFLDRHGVDCGHDGVVTQFNLTRAGNGNYRYNYQCARSRNPLRCRDVSTPANDNGRGNAVYLDRHHVGCNANESLSAFRLVRPSEGTIAYHYRCCS
jgi:hypothetical protein